MFNKVTKSDVNIAEKVFIAESSSLNFANENALSLSFDDMSFDLVYSISVVEHIYQDYLHAINGMIRVTKKRGFVYLTFPVSREHTEEWLDENIYSNQYKRSDKTFFQYRFDEEDVDGIFNNMRGVEIISREIFWERKNGEYDRAVAKLKHKCNNRYLDIIKDAILNIYYGFTLLDREPHDFSKSRSFGNMFIILRKI
jgi:SAM-dependent methyltransferase